MRDGRLDAPSKKAALGMPIAEILTRARAPGRQTHTPGSEPVNDFTKHGGIGPVTLSEPTIQALLDHHPHVVLVTDRQGRVKTANRAAGWLLQEGKESSLHELSDSVAWRSAVAEGSALSGTLVLRGSDGVARTVQITALPAPADDPHRISILNRGGALDRDADERFRIIADLRR